MSEDVGVTTRHRRKLAVIRKERDEQRENDRGYLEAASGEFSAAQRASEDDDTGSEGSNGIAGSGTGRTEEEPGIVGRYDIGIRSSDITDEHAAENHDQTELRPIELTPEQKHDKRRELARQRKARQRQRERAEKGPVSSSNVSSDSDGRDMSFVLKSALSPKKETPAKVFTEKEAKDHLEKLVFVYQRGSSLLDDILEIIVKGHEKVEIWALSEEEATILATSHVERAKKDATAARSARTLVNIYDRMYLFMLVGPRVMATGQHIKGHGGISFK